MCVCVFVHMHGAMAVESGNLVPIMLWSELETVFYYTSCWPVHEIHTRTLHSMCDSFKYFRTGAEHYPQIFQGRTFSGPTAPMPYPLTTAL